VLEQTPAQAVQSGLALAARRGRAGGQKIFRPYGLGKLCHIHMQRWLPERKPRKGAALHQFFPRWGRQKRSTG